MKKILLAILVAFAGLSCFAQSDQTATVWGIKSDGVTDNTASIQRAIDYISAHGGVAPEYIIHNSDPTATGTTAGTTGDSTGTGATSNDEQLMHALKLLS